MTMIYGADSTFPTSKKKGTKKMTGSQYKNVAQWTLANTTTDDTANDTAAVKAVFDNCGVAFPSGDSEEVLMTLMTDEYMGWENCTYSQAQEAANNGIVTVGVDADHVVIILPDDTVSSNETIAETDSSVARTVSEISTTERSTMQFFASTATTTTSYRLLTKYQTENPCYKAATSIGTPTGIVVHSTGSANKYLRRYVDYPEELGVNAYGNHWNNSKAEEMVHAFIGLDKNDKIAIVNTLPYDYAC